MRAARSKFAMGVLFRKQTGTGRRLWMKRLFGASHPLLRISASQLQLDALSLVTGLVFPLQSVGKQKISNPYVQALEA